MIISKIVCTKENWKDIVLKLVDHWLIQMQKEKWRNPPLS